jgi:hypothetical protein
VGEDLEEDFVGEDGEGGLESVSKYTERGRGEGALWGSLISRDAILVVISAIDCVR